MKSISFKKNILLPLMLMVLSGFTGLLFAAEGDVRVTKTGLERNGNLLTSTVSLDFSDMKVKSNQAVVFTPILVNGQDTLELDGAGVYGRTRWYQFERSGNFPVSGQSETALHAGKAISVSLSQNIPYQEWMNGSRLLLKRTDYGCEKCGDSKVTMDDLAAYRAVEYQPVFIFQEAKAEEVKTREISGRAFIDFKVNQTTILPDYRNNQYELGKIISGIDSVKNDRDITVTSLSIKGTASPEGPYANNERLAKGRTEALKNYVKKLYNFPEGFIKTSWEAVDWAGLINWLENHNIENKQGILDIINGNLAPEAKNSRIQSTYPEQYKYLLENVYPSLRHSDYRIEYTIRQFTNLQEISEVMATSPQKLSLNEMYLLANSFEAGSPEYNEVYETAVRLYPNDLTANLNAANVAMQKGDLQNAAKYLSKAGDSAEATYARGVYAALTGDYETGIKLVKEAIQQGVEDKQGLLELMEEASRYVNN